ncbi:MAG: glycosyltransferase family 4 protein [Proteobacteria bacterium]|nr:glycosyltransferase family 4 protein [Pseudomonadota bacterium]
MSDNFPPERNASASRVFEQAVYWVQSKCQVSVLTCAPNFPEGKLFKNYRNKWHQTEVMEGIQVHRIKTFMAKNQGVLLRSLDYASYLIPALVTGLFFKKKDIIIANYPTPFVALAGLALSFVHKAPLILQVSDLWPASILAVEAMNDNRLIRWLEKLELYLYRQSAKIIVLTHAFKKNLIARGINPEKIIVILNGVELNKFAPRPANKHLAAQFNLLPEEFVAGYIGTLGMAHALENVLFSAELLKGKAPIRFLIVGAGAEREKLENLIKKKNLCNVILVESQPKEKILDFWSLCNVALIHLKNSQVFSEVIPSKIFEAMAMGIPVIISAPAGEATALVVEEHIGIHLPPEDPKTLADTLLHYSKNRHELVEFSQNCFKSALKYNRQRQAMETLNTLTGVYQNFYGKTS